VPRGAGVPPELPYRLAPARPGAHPSPPRHPIGWAAAAGIGTRWERLGPEPAS
ncbi:hypothetical protein P7K49_021296, partial [Saguinus oedipus]